MNTLFRITMFIILVPYSIFVLYTILIVMPYASVIEAKCLSLGYPNYKTTWDFKGYCIEGNNVVLLTKEG
jgi:hypothetical protein